MTSYKITNQIV